MSAARILPPGEWGRLPEDVAAFCASLNPEDVAPVVVEDEGVIVARMLVIRAPHWESFWMADEAQGNAGITRALLRGAIAQAQKWAPNWVIANAETGPMCDTLERLGGQWLPVHTFMLPTTRLEMEGAECPTLSVTQAQPPSPSERTTDAWSGAPVQAPVEDSLCPLL